MSIKDDKWPLSDLPRNPHAAGEERSPKNELLDHIRHATSRESQQFKVIQDIMNYVTGRIAFIASPYQKQELIDWITPQMVEDVKRSEYGVLIERKSFVKSVATDVSVWFDDNKFIIEVTAPKVEAKEQTEEEPTPRTQNERPRCWLDNFNALINLQSSDVRRNPVTTASYINDCVVDHYARPMYHPNNSSQYLYLSETGWVLSYVVNNHSDSILFCLA